MQDREPRTDSIDPEIKALETFVTSVEALVKANNADLPYKDKLAQRAEEDAGRVLDVVKDPSLRIGHLQRVGETKPLVKAAANVIILAVAIRRFKEAVESHLGTA